MKQSEDSEKGGCFARNLTLDKSLDFETLQLLQCAPMYINLYLYQYHSISISISISIAISISTVIKLYVYILYVYIYICI